LGRKSGGLVPQRSTPGHRVSADWPFPDGDGDPASVYGRGGRRRPTPL